MDQVLINAGTQAAGYLMAAWVIGAAGIALAVGGLSLARRARVAWRRG